MEIHEYFYIERREQNTNHKDVIFRCRYCEKPVYMETNTFLNRFMEYMPLLEKEATIHMMECKKFYELRKQEIEEEV
jgi:hypothetical protein